MSGVEAAGFVLAVFPLVISALEHYREGLEPLKDWWRFRSDFLALIHQVGYQYVVFEENIEELLSPIVQSEFELATLRQDPRGQAWHDPDLEIRLRHRLPRSYEWYCGIMEDLQKSMQKLMEKLRISKESEAKWALYEKGSGVFKSKKWDFELNRLRYVLSKRKRERLLDTIGKHNTALQTLLGSSERLAPLRKERKARAAAALKIVRENASSLYRVLCSCWPCKCPAHNHTAHLLLESRPAQVDPDTGSELDSFTLQHASTFNTREQNSWRIAFLEVRPRKRVQKTEPPAALSPTLIKSKTLYDVRMGSEVNQAKHFRSMELNSKRNKIVSFKAEYETKSVCLETEERIIDLCARLRGSKPNEPIGFLSDGHLDHVFNVSKAPMETKQQCVTLGYMLKQGIERRQRIILGIILASSLLQLHATRWMHSSWGKENILFLPSEQSSGCCDISRPFLARSSHALPSSQDDCEASDGESKEALFKLGVLLLELCFGQTLEEQAFRKEYLGPDGKPNRFTDRATATVWQESALGEGGELFSTAIRRCIDCAFGTSSVNLADSDLRQAVHDNVVEQLKSVLRAHDGTSV